MNRTHAVEIVLTRALTGTEAEAVEARSPGRYAFSSDQKRATRVLVAGTVPEALEHAWAQAVDGELPPVDVIWSVYPDEEGRVQLRLELDAEVAERLHDRAERLDLTMEALIEEALREAIRHEARLRRVAARGELGRILQRYSLEELLSALLAPPANDG